LEAQSETMKIYTKTGDQGETGLFGGGRVRKDHPRIRAYGAIDELNAAVGWIRSLASTAVIPEISPFLEKIQNDLFDIGAVLATPDPAKLKGKLVSFVTDKDTAALEASIDRMETKLDPLKTFILPGGSELAARCHIARTVCRRAERDVVALAETEASAVDPEVVVYVNRLSDYFFVLARWANAQEGIPDVAWKKK